MPPPVPGRTPSWRHRISPRVRYGLAVVVVAVAAASTMALRSVVTGPMFQTPLLLCAVVISSWVGGTGPGLLATGLAFLTLDHFALARSYFLELSWADIPRLVMFNLAGAIVSWLGGRQRQDEEALVRARDELEEKVLARTADLQQTNEQLVREIDERIKAEQARIQAQDALRKAEADLGRVARATTLGELTASIAHEINQPLAAVVTNGNACLRWLAPERFDLDEARAAVQRILRDGNRAAEVIARIRALLAKGQQVRQRLRINDVIEDLLPLVDAEVRRRGAKLERHLADGLPAVEMDRVQIQQVMMNLMVNGLDAMGGITDRPRLLRVRTSGGEQEILIAVEDSGVGLDDGTIDRLFDPFFTTKTEGLGMGLAICRSIAESHGGRLHARANDGHGATFHFTLPLDGGAG